MNFSYIPAHFRSGRERSAHYTYVMKANSDACS